MSAAAPRRFGAFIDPDRVYVIEYRRSATGIEITDHRSVARSLPDITDAADALVAVLRSAGGSGKGRVTVTIRGFGISYHLLTLPPAGAEILAPVVDREMRRLFPEVPDPVVSFAVGGHLDRRTWRSSSASQGLTERRAAGTDEVLPLEILAAAAPRRVVETIVERLEAGGMHLDHLTVLPQAMAQLHREINGSDGAAALAIMLPGAPVIGVFHDGDVRFVAEPPAAPDALSADDIQTVIDQVGRARIHLRHHFRGADVEKMHVAADSADRDHVGAVLNASLNVEILPLAPTVGPPPAVAALGGVLNAEIGTDLALYPSADQVIHLARQRRADSLTVAAVVVCIIAIAFAVFQAISVSRSAAELQAQRAAADAQMARTAPAMGVIEQRRANYERIGVIDAHRDRRHQLARVLNGLRLAQPPNVGISSATATRTDSGWAVAVAGRAVGSTGGQVLRGVDSFYRELPRRIPLDSLNLDSFDYVSGDVVAGDFRISFASGARSLR